MGKLASETKKFEGAAMGKWTVVFLDTNSLRFFLPSDRCFRKRIAFHVAKNWPAKKMGCIAIPCTRKLAQFLSTRDIVNRTAWITEDLTEFHRHPWDVFIFDDRGVFRANQLPLDILEAERLYTLLGEEISCCLCPTGSRVPEITGARL